MTVIVCHFTFVTLQITKVGGAGFEPAKAEPADLQSAPFDRFGNPPTLHLALSNAALT